MKPSEEDLRVAREITCSIRYLREKGRGLLLTSIVTAITAARAETWKEAIAEVRNVVKGWRSDVDESWGERPDLSFEAADKVAGAMEIVTALEAAAGSKTKVFSRED